MIIILTSILSALLAAYFTPIIRRGALRFGVLDSPDGKLKHQQQAIPYLGGVAVYLAYLLSIALVYRFSHQVMGLLLAGTVVMTLGLFDDFKVLTPRVKFLGQLLAALVLVKADIRLHIVFLPEWLAVFLSFLWIVAVTNAINIIDISDGLASSVCTGAAMVLGFISFLNGNTTITVLAAALVGAGAGFLPYNWAPARIYLGDTGAMFFGLILAAISMINQYDLRHPVSLMAPVAILAVPLFDTAFVMLSRLAARRSMFLGSSDHFAIRLKQRGWSTHAVALLSASVTFMFGSAAVTSMYLSADIAAGLYAVFVITAGGAALWLWKWAPPPKAGDQSRKTHER